MATDIKILGTTGSVCTQSLKILGTTQSAGTKKIKLLGAEKELVCETAAFITEYTFPAGFIFTLPVQDFSGNGYDAGMKFDFDIDWGDGTTEHYAADNGMSSAPTHTYVNGGIYHVKITGICDWFRFDWDYIDYNGFYEDGDFMYLNKVVSFGNIVFKRFSISYCRNCTALPNEAISFIGNPTEDDQIVLQFSSLEALESLPEKLLDKCTGLTSFRNMFRFNPSLSSVPEGLFSKCTSANDFTSCFWNCTALQEVPSLWTLYPSANGDTCFAGCTNAVNFDDIPAHWK